MADKNNAIDPQQRRAAILPVVESALDRLEGGLGQLEVFAEAPQSPLRPVPGVADLEVGGERAEAGEGVVKEARPRRGIDDVVPALEERDEEAEAALADLPRERLVIVELVRLPGRDAEERLARAALGEIVEDGVAAGRRDGQAEGVREGDRPRVEPGPETGEVGQDRRGQAQVRPEEIEIARGVPQMIAETLALGGHVVRLVGEFVPGEGEAHVTGSEASGPASGAGASS